MLRHRNTKLQGNIQKAINIIEEKMVDVLSTHDQSYKKRTIDRMEKEINKVLKMINEQNSTVVKKEDEVEVLEREVQKSILKNDNVRERQEPEDNRSVFTNQDQEKRDTFIISSSTNAKALISPVALKMPRPPRKRSISRVLKFNSRPSTVEEERSFDSGDPELFRINEVVASGDKEVPELQEEIKEERLEVSEQKSK